MKYREIRKLYARAGWEVVRQKGSHQVWTKDGAIEVIAGQDSDDVPRGLLSHFLKRLGLK
jgi:predicted RNA binding protein YcfA (HicA-like mRNA interferase family)